MEKQFEEKEDQKVTIIKKDRGVEFKKLQHICDIMDARYRNFKNSVHADEESNLNLLKKEAFEVYGINKKLESIEELEENKKQIDEQIQSIRDEIKEYTSDGSGYHYRYSEPAKGSKVDQYIQSRKEEKNYHPEKLEFVKSEIQDKIFLASDIEEVRQLYFTFIAKLEEEKKKVKNII